jgi:Na+-transporting NADH:ubiquinone oxidoreductase subunit NqrB
MNPALIGPALLVILIPAEPDQHDGPPHDGDHP